MRQLHFKHAILRAMGARVLLGSESKIVKPPSPNRSYPKGLEYLMIRCAATKTPLQGLYPNLRRGGSMGLEVDGNPWDLSRHHFTSSGLPDMDHNQEDYLGLGKSCRFADASFVSIPR